MDKILLCSHCGKELNINMEIEYSNHMTSYFCNPDCALKEYFEAMGSTPLDLMDKEDIGDKRIEIKNGKLFSID